MENKILELIKDSTSIERKVEIIQELTSQRLARLLGVSKIPGELEYIVIEISTKRYNRLGSEGFKRHSQEGLSLEFYDSDFDEFKDDIDRWLKENKPSKRNKGWVFFNA